MSERITMSLYNVQQAHQAIQTAWHHAKGWLARATKTKEGSK